MDDYQTALLSHIKESAPLASAHKVDTVYFGGGTPSYYGEKRITELLKVIKKQFHLTKDVEITMEVNPDSVTKKSLTHLRRAGINRISMGMQSSQDDQLLDLNRAHSFQQTKVAVQAVRDAKIKNLSLDVMFGLPNQSMEQWQATVEEALLLQPQHISGYGLKVEDGTPLAQRTNLDTTIPEDDPQADMYLWMVERLAQAGLNQYEISNFAKGGCTSRHNLKYWMTQPYMGFGPGAHSDFGNRRYSFIRDIETYITNVSNGGPITDSDDLIPERERCGEYLMLRLRTIHGISGDDYRRTFFMNFQPLLEKLEGFQTRGWTSFDGSHWHLTPEGFLMSNYIIGQLLDCQEKATLESTLKSFSE